MWNWENYKCNNRHTCWGPNIRFLEIQRRDFKWLFNFYDIYNNKYNPKLPTTRRQIERLYIKTQQDEKFSILEEYGQTSRFAQLSLFLQNDNNNNTKKYIHMKVNSKQNTPKEFCDMRKEEKPPLYQSPTYICPNSIIINIYTSEITLQEPIDELYLIQNCKNTEKIYMNMYPGGAGLEV